jgi:hypothetical protein
VLSDEEWNAWLDARREALEIAPEAEPAETESDTTGGAADSSGHAGLLMNEQRGSYRG